MPRGFKVKKKRSRGALGFKEGWARKIHQKGQVDGKTTELQEEGEKATWGVGSFKRKRTLRL